MSKPKIDLPKEVFNSVVEDVTGSSDTELFTVEQAREVIIRVMDLKGKVIRNEKSEPDKDDVVLKQFGF